MQQLVILLVINSPSTCFVRLFAHRQEVGLRYTACGFLSCCNCCDVVESAGKLCALCGVGCLLQSALNQCTVLTFTESEDTRCCVNTIFPPEDGHVNARNMSRIIV